LILNKKKLIKQSDVNQHQDWSDEKEALLTSIKTLIDKGFVKTQTDINNWAVKEEERFEDLQNNDSWNHGILIKELQNLRQTLPKEKGLNS
jgi:hypothetical protein